MGRLSAFPSHFPTLAAAFCGSLLLAACGFNGTDPDKDEQAPAATAAAAPSHEEKF